jgi:hypothetical protein
MRTNPADLPPGLAAFLLNDCKFSSEVVSRCLLELAAEGVVRLDSQPDGPPLVSLAEASPRTGRELLPFEDALLPRIGERTRLAPVPLTVLFGDDGDEFTRWRKQVTEALSAAAKQERLARVWPGRRALVISLSIMAGALAVGIGSLLRPGDGPTVPITALYIVAAGFTVLWTYRRLRPTAAGRAAANWWRNRGGPAPVGLDGAGQVGQPVYDRLEAAAEVHRADVSLPPNHVWSSAGGQWHPVKVGRATLAQTTWGTSGTLAGLIATVVVTTAFAGIIGFIAAGVNHIPIARFAGLVPLALGAILILGSWLPTRSRRMKLPDSVNITGQVVKIWTIDGGDWPDGYGITIDDGQAPAASSVVLDMYRYGQLKLQVGDSVQVDYSLKTLAVNDIKRVVDSAR